ncbi:MAG TPA: hypothetical protein VF522_13275 [Ramlibacter sp.]|uniref:hypothetical protein n=1 Tax=Ramlibacter sp. TaxID=1917967 RepID=UPI002ED494FB
MRSRFILLVVAILLIAGFAALNWSEIVRPAPLLIGPIMMDAPLGAILLGLLALAVVVFALSAASMRTHTLLESRHHYKELEAQRALADKAEASRFTDLRGHMDNHMRDLRERDSIAATELEKARLEHRREINTQLEQINRTLSARLNEMEHRLETRFERMGYGRAAPVAGAAPPVLRSEVERPNTVREHAEAREEVQQQAREQQANQAQMREEERLRDDRIREERDLRSDEERARAENGERRPESGWRRWF